MLTNTDLQMICDRGLSALNEVRAHVVTFANLEQQIKAAESRLALLQGQIQAAEKLAPQLEEMDQQLRARRSELAELDLTIAKKHDSTGQSCRRCGT